MDKTAVPALPARSRVPLEQYESLIGAEAFERLRAKAEKVRDLHVVNVSSTHYGGGVAEILSSLTLLKNRLGLRCGWRVIQGRPDFFSITKKIHNALQGADINLSELKIQIYEEVMWENACRTHFDHDFVVIHDPQPLGMITQYRRKAPWIWRCHVDLTNPHDEVWRYLSQFIEQYDAVIFSIPEYAQNLPIPQLFFMPAIDPFSITNRDLGDQEIDERLAHYDVPTDLPLIAQVSRFDHWKDPMGVIETFRRVRREVDCTLVLLGNIATDDPEGQEVFESLLDAQEERIIVLSVQDSCLVNALQRRAAVVLQKSLREGFGLTVTEAMWKQAAVVAGNVGGIRHQIEDGKNGFLVANVEEAGERTVQLLRDEQLRRRLGKAAHRTVRERFLITRLAEQYLDLFNAFTPSFRLAHPPEGPT